MNLFALLLATAGALTPVTTTMGAAASVSPKAPAAVLEALSSPQEKAFGKAETARPIFSYLQHDNMPTVRDKYVQETTMPGAPTSEYPLLDCGQNGLSDLSSLFIAVSSTSTCSTPRFASQMQAVNKRRDGTCYLWRVRAEPEFVDSIGGNMAKTAWFEATPADRDFWTVISPSGYSTDSSRTAFGALHLFSPMTNLPRRVTVSKHPWRYSGR